MIKQGRQDSNKVDAGHTLVEVLFAVVILVLIVGGCYFVLYAGNASWHVNNTKMQLQQELRKGADWIMQDIRQTGSAAVSNVPEDSTWYNTIKFKTANGVSSGAVNWTANDISYLLAGSGGDELHRQVLDSSSTVLQDHLIAQNIQTFQVRRQVTTPGIVDVNIQSQEDAVTGQTINLQTDFRIRMRN